MSDEGVTPFRWWLECGAISPNILPRVPTPASPVWEAHYSNDHEHGKRTSRRLEMFPFPVRQLFNKLRCGISVQRWSDRLRVELEDDPTLHGGGIHVMAPGGWLATHLDYARHPHYPDKERRLNLIAFLNDEWFEEWGGALIFCDPLGNVVRRIYPAPGRLVAFETGDDSYHGVEPVTGPMERVTAAVYLLSDARPGVSRQRALFMPKRT